MLGHWFDILIVLIVGLLVFGPKRVIEIGSQVGKMVRELRESTRDLNFSSLLSTDEPPKQTSYTNTVSASPAAGATTSSANGAPPPESETIVEGGVEHSVEHTVEHTEDLVN